MLAIDLKTMFLFLVIGNVFAIIFFLIYPQLHKTRSGKFKKYVLARSLQTITWLAYFLSIRDLDPPTMAVTMIPLALGIALEVYCLLTFNQGFNKKKFLSLSAIALAHSIGYYIFSENLYIRVIIASTFISFYYGYVWIDFSLRKGRSTMQMAGGWIGFIVSVLFISRAIHPLFHLKEFVVYSQHYSNVFAGFGLIVVSFSWPLIFLLLLKEEDEAIILKKDKHILRQNDQLRNFNAAKDRFFRIVSHDLRTPMASMISFLDLIDDEVKQKDFSNIEAYLDLINQSAQESFILLDNLLHWSILQSGKNKAAFQSIDLNKLINSLIQLFKIDIEKKNIRVIANVDSQLIITSDKFMLETTLRNLFSNAIKFTYKGGSININAHHVNNFVQIEIEDTGIGISPTNLKKLFKIESNYTSEGTNHEKGTGLGLVLCKEFVKNINGKLEAKSEPGIGSTFRILLPVEGNPK